MKRSALLGVALALLTVVFALGASAARKPVSQGPSIHYGPVQLYVSNVAAQEGTTATMQLKLQWMMPMDVKVSWKTVPATATAPRDYLHQWGEVVIEKGKLTTDCLISSVNDTIFEPNRDFKVVFWSDNPLVKIVGTPATYTIQDDDPVPAVSIHDQASNTVYEGGDLTWTVSLTNPSYLPVDVALDGGANVWTTLLPADYDGSIPTAVHFAPGEVTHSFTIHTHDHITEASKGVWIWMTGATNAQMPAVDYLDPASQDDCWGFGGVLDGAD